MFAPAASPQPSGAHVGPSSPLSTPPSDLLLMTSSDCENDHPSPCPYSQYPNHSGTDDGEDSHLNEADGGEPDDEARRASPSVRMSRRRKLEIMVRALRRTRWTFEDFIKAWVGFDGNQDVRVSHRQYHKQRQRRNVMSKTMRTLERHGICQETPVVERCMSELNQLILLPPFSTFELGMDLDKLDYVAAVLTIQQTAPTWYSLLWPCLHNRRALRPSYYTRKRDNPIHKRMFAVTSMVCFSRALKTSNTLPSCVGIYLQGSGVHRRVIETLAGLGICHTYHHINSLMDDISKRASVCLTRSHCF